APCGRSAPTTSSSHATPRKAEVLPKLLLSLSSVYEPPSCAPTHGNSLDPTTTTVCWAMTTLAAAPRRSGLFAIASVTSASSVGSLNDFNQSLVNSPLAGSARQAGGMRVA